MNAREKLMLDALKEAFSASNYGNCLASIVSAIRVFDPKWLKKQGRGK